jgi:hypothetical protein
MPEKEPAAAATSASEKPAVIGGAVGASFEQVHTLLASITTPSRKPPPTSPAKPSAGTSPSRRLLPEAPATWPALIDPVTCSPWPARDMAHASSAGDDAQLRKKETDLLPTGDAPYATPTKTVVRGAAARVVPDLPQHTSPGPAYGRVAHARSTAVHSSRQQAEHLLLHAERKQALAARLTLPQVTAN